MGFQICAISFSLISIWKTHWQRRVGGATRGMKKRRVRREEGRVETSPATRRRALGEGAGEGMDEKRTLEYPIVCEDETNHGTAIGNILGLYNLVKAFGMYYFCKACYNMLQKCPWTDKKYSFEGNRKKMPGGNIGEIHVPSSLNKVRSLCLTSVHFTPPIFSLFFKPDC